MTITTYLLYLAAVAVLVLTPGPTMLMSITNAASHGTAKVLASSAGSVTAVLGVMLLSAMGLGALLAASDMAFSAFAARLAPWLRKPGRARWFNRASGSLFAGMGALLLLVRRPA